MAIYGYRSGPRIPVLKPVDADTSAISVGDILTVGTTGYVKQASAGENIYGVAMQAVASPSADGDVSILVDVSEDSVYEYPPDAGSVTQTLAGQTCDVGGAQTIDIDASLDDNVKIHKVDTDANTVFCSFSLTFTGVA